MPIVVNSQKQLEEEMKEAGMTQVNLLALALATMPMHNRKEMKKD